MSKCELVSSQNGDIFSVLRRYPLQVSDKTLPNFGIYTELTGLLLETDSPGLGKNKRSVFPSSLTQELQTSKDTHLSAPIHMKGIVGLSLFITVWLKLL